MVMMASVFAFALVQATGYSARGLVVGMGPGFRWCAALRRACDTTQ